MVRFSRTGGEAMTIAVRIARAYTGKDKIAFCGYHGWHDWYLAANLSTENALGEHLLPGLSPRGVPKGLTGTAIPFRYNHLEELQAIVEQNRNDLAAIVMEPIRSIHPKSGFLEGVRGIADEIGAVFIIDEVSAAFRMNSGGAHLLLGIKPDMAVFSKALGNGYPIAAIIGKADIMQAAQSTFISSTNWTERIGSTAALATIKKHKAVDAGKHLMAIGHQVQDGWALLAKKNNLKIDIGGIPPLSHFSFEYDNSLSMKALFVQLMLEKGFLASTLFYAMFAHQSHHVEQYLQSVDKVFSEIFEADQAGNLEKRLRGKPATAGFKRLA
jgi:glutamate-1-semialdehyde 2,1-aminomutase